MDSKTKTAKNVLNSWIRAAGIETACVADADIGIKTPTGSVGIKIGTGSKEGIVYVSANDIVGRDNKHSVMFFYNLMNSLGVSFSPVHRGDIDDLNKRTYDGRDLPDGTSEIEFTYMRHLEFRTAPNLSSKDWELYGKCINTAARVFFNRNHNRLKRLLIDMDDLVQYGRVWTVNFLHRYRKDSVAATSSILMNYLKQRYAEYFKLMCRQEASFQPSMGVLEASTYADKLRSFDYSEYGSLNAGHISFKWAENPDVESFQHSTDEVESETKPHAYRTQVKHAQARLKKAMDSMDREQLVDLLKHAAANEYIAADAQELAQRLLNGLEGETQEHA